MSLTSQLAIANSPVNAYFKDNFTKLPEFLFSDNNQLEKCPSIIPKNQTNYMWSEVGHIVEYLICLSVGVSLKTIMPVHYLATGNSFSGNMLIKELEKSFAYPLDAESVHFADQCKYLLILAHIEAGLRSHGKITIDFQTKLPLVMLEDLKNIFTTSIKGNELLRGKYVYNPVFDLSSQIGGADADLIKVRPNRENLLIDVKTTKIPKINPGWICQLLGYVFLDKSNYYKMNEVAVYLPRQNVMLNWTVEDIVLNSSNFKTVKEAKKEFIKQVSATELLMVKRVLK